MRRGASAVLACRFLKSVQSRRVLKVAKHIEACKAQVVFLSESCNEATYKKLIQADQQDQTKMLVSLRCTARACAWRRTCP